MCVKRFSRREQRQGATIILMLLMMTIIVGMVAFSVEVGRMFVLRTQVQSAVDSGALAATLRMQWAPTDLEGAAAAARDYIQRNIVGRSQTIPLESIDVEIGVWNDATEVFTVTNVEPNAVRVTGRQDNEPFFFGRIFGKTTFGAPASAVASGNAAPLDIMLVLDLSGSMADEGRIQALRNAAPAFVTVIEDEGGDDQIGVMGLSADPSSYNPVAAGHLGTLYLPPGLNPSNDHHVGVLEYNLSDNYSHLRSTVLSSSNLIAGKYTGTTGTGGSLRDAAHYLDNSVYARSEARRIIVLMSDGLANKPSSGGPAYARSMATYAANLGVTVYTISLGNGADLTLMQDIADTTNGQHFDATGSGVEELTQVLTDAFEQAAQAIKRPQLVQ